MPRPVSARLIASRTRSGSKPVPWSDTAIVQSQSSMSTRTSKLVSEELCRTTFAHASVTARATSVTHSRWAPSRVRDCRHSARTIGTDLVSVGRRRTNCNCTLALPAGVSRTARPRSVRDAGANLSMKRRSSEDAGTVLEGEEVEFLVDLDRRGRDTVLTVTGELDVATTP